MEPKTHTPIYCWKAEEQAPRCSQKTEVEETVCLMGDESVKIPLTYTKYGEAPELPSPQPFTLYIVSDVIAKRYKGLRDDLRIVNGQIRNNLGKVIGCRSLGRI